MAIPILRRPPRGKLELNLPRRAGQRGVLQSILPERTQLRHDLTDWKWRIARHLYPVAAIALCRHYGAVHVVDEGRTIAHCTVACQTADPSSPCECICGGTNHGGVEGGVWRQVGGELLVSVIEQHDAFTLRLDAHGNVTVEGAV